MIQQMMSVLSDATRQLHAAQRRQLELFQTLALTPARKAAPAHPATLAVDRAVTYQSLAHDAFVRQMMAVQALFSLAWQPDRQDYGIAEAAEMQRAILARLQAQQAELGAGLAAVGQTASGVRKADTLSKLMEQEYNVAAQLGALLNGQLTAMVGLMESMQIGYGYLIASKAGGPSED